LAGHRPNVGAAMLARQPWLNIHSLAGSTALNSCASMSVCACVCARMRSILAIPFGYTPAFTARAKSL
jgi:hypothetical protein